MAPTRDDRLAAANTVAEADATLAYSGLLLGTEASGGRAIAAKFAKVPWQSMVAVLLFAAVWQVAAPLLNERGLIPRVTDVLQAWFSIYQDGQWLPAISTTFQAFGLGIALAAVFGVVVGVAAHYSRTIDYVIRPYVTMFMAIPITALVPALLIIFGRGMATRVVVVFLYAFFVIVLNVQSGLRSVNPAHLELARAFGASPLQLLFKIQFPSSLPWLATGFRLGVAKGLKGAVNAELIIMVAGLGFLMMQYAERFDLASVTAVGLTMVALVVVLLWIVDLCERRLIKWTS